MKAIKRGVKSAEALRKVAEHALTAPSGSLEVDKLQLPYGRGALASAAAAAAKADFFHTRAVRSPERDAALRAALCDAIDAAERIGILANLSGSALAAANLIAAARVDLERLELPKNNRRGSPGRPIERAAAEAVALVWSEHERRAIPRGGIANRSHSLAILFEAISEDMFRNRGRITAAHLRPARNRTDRAI